MNFGKETMDKNICIFLRAQYGLNQPEKSKEKQKVVMKSNPHSRNLQCWGLKNIIKVKWLHKFFSISIIMEAL